MAIADRELQMLLLKLAIASAHPPQFSKPDFSVRFSAINLKNFHSVPSHSHSLALIYIHSWHVHFCSPLRKPLDQGRAPSMILALTEQSQILSVESPRIVFEQRSDPHITSSAGWVDFNDTCVGVTCFQKGTEVYTEVCYHSIESWHFDGILREYGRQSCSSARRIYNQTAAAIV